jgi:hypothetical protein
LALDRRIAWFIIGMPLEEGYMHHRIVASLSVTLILFCFGFVVEPQAQAQNDVTKAKAIQKYLADNFGMPGYKTSWFDSIKGILVQGHTVVAETNLPGANAKASGVCSGVSGYVFANENRGLGLENVEVRGPKGAVLIKRVGLRGKCS